MMVTIHLAEDAVPVLKRALYRWHERRDTERAHALWVAIARGWVAFA